MQSLYFIAMSTYAVPLLPCQHMQSLYFHVNICSPFIYFTLTWIYVLLSPLTTSAHNFKFDENFNDLFQFLINYKSLWLVFDIERYLFWHLLGIRSNDIYFDVKSAQLCLRRSRAELSWRDVKINIVRTDAALHSLDYNFSGKNKFI